MAELSANQRSFIEMMQRSDEHAVRGFGLLLKHPQFIDFFEPLIEAGLFAPQKNPEPIRADIEGRFRVPYWRALDYLKACAKVAGANADGTLADRVLKIIRSVSSSRDSASDRVNFYTFQAFAEILGLLPTPSVTSEDLALVEGWLNTKFDHDLVAMAIDEHTLPHFLNSNDPMDWLKAVQLFKYCTAVRWEASRLEGGSQEPVTLVEENWLKDLVDHHAVAIGRKAGPSAASLMVERVREVFGQGGRAEWSEVFRPAVEEDRDRPSGRGAENIVVEALRDILQGWMEVDAAAVKPFVDGLLRSDNQMLRRIGIHFLNEGWETFGDLYLPLVRRELFESGHLHELYRLLQLRFDSFADGVKAATVEALRLIPAPEGEDGPERLERLQFRWLSAIAATSYEPVATWLGELTAKYGSPPKHADSLGYIETRWGPGPSLYSAEELVALANQRSLISKLMAFKPSDSWDGPTLDALTDQLERAVQLAPATFVRALPDFLSASITYQHAVIAGFLKLWRETTVERPFEGGDHAWPKLFDFFDALLQNQTFWDQMDGMPPAREVTPMWVASVVADLLQAGTRDDNHAYPAALLPRGWAMLHTLLARTQSVTEPSDDPMFQAINSSRGRVLEAAFNHALRVCRLADKEVGSHISAWANMQTLFDKELTACESGNYEFSTLAGAYSGNIEYLNVEWLERNIKEIFPIDRPANLVCAISGLAYAPISRKVCRMLREHGVLDAALRLDIKGRHGREKLLERVAVGYLWGEDTLDSSRFKFLFEKGSQEDLAQISFFFWTIRGEQLKEEYVLRILDYWRLGLEWGTTQPTPPIQLLSSLSRLTILLPNANSENGTLLLETAPFVQEHHGAYEFIKELTRLVEQSPSEVCSVLRRFIETHSLTYDYEHRMRKLVARLAELGYRAAAIDFCNRLRSLPGLFELFLELTATPPAAT
jgi:hypothetical protein